MHETHPRVYAMLKQHGHDPAKAIYIMIEARRGDKFSLRWIRTLRATR